MTSVIVVTVTFEFLKTQLLFQILINCKLKFNVSPLKSTSSMLSSSKELLWCSKEICKCFYNESFQPRKKHYNQVLYLKRKYNIGCLIPFGPLPTILSHFRWFFFIVLQFITFHRFFHQVFYNPISARNLK